MGNRVTDYGYDGLHMSLTAHLMFSLNTCDGFTVSLICSKASDLMDDGSTS